jgi:hypothetical protein
MKRRNLLSLLTLMTGLFSITTFGWSTAVEAQVVISVGVQEIYDDNIYLESDTGFPPPIVIDEDLTDPEVVIDPPTQANGDPDNDLITNAYVSLSGAIPLSPKLKSAAEARVGALLFADYGDESRATLDANLSISTEKGVIPDPFTLTTNHAIKSSSNDITVASGTATRQSQAYDGNISLGAAPIALGSATNLGAAYSLGYHAFLGDFTFNEKATENLGPFEDRFEDRGSDYLTNSIDTNIDQTITENLVGGIYAGVSDIIFTSVESSNISEETEEEDDLDRIEARTGVRSTYRLSKSLTLSGTTGVSLSRLDTEPADQTLTTVADDGTETTTVLEGQQDDLSLTFGASVAYAPDSASSIKLAVDQGQKTDIDGDRIITRSVSLDGSRAFGDRFRLRAGAMFLQYNIGDNISKPTERLEGSVSAQYNLTQTIALEIGYNYTKQDADESNTEQRFFFNTEDYESSRAFIGLTTGIVGTKG